METGYKAFKASVMKSIQIEEHRFGVEPEIVAKLARTAVSHQQQRDVARRAANHPPSVAAATYSAACAQRFDEIRVVL
jgi:hypothetical protein